MSSIILVRHGETAYNKKGTGASADAEERIRGHIDVPLDEDGIRQAKETADKLSKEVRVATIWSSPLERALVTALYIAKKSGIDATDIHQSPALKPWDVGDWAGKPASEVLPQMKAYAMEPTKRAPGGESFGHFAARFLHQLKRIVLSAQGKRGDIVIVTHTRNMQVTKGWLAAGAREDMAYDPKVVDDYSNETATGHWLAMRAA